MITSKQIRNGTISPKDLAKSVQTKLNAGAKALKVIANGSVGTAQLADNSISSAKIAALAVTTAKLAEGAVTTGKLGDASVTTAKLADGSVTNPKLGDDAVNSAKVAAGLAHGYGPGAERRWHVGAGTDAVQANLRLDGTRDRFRLDRGQHVRDRRRHRHEQGAHRRHAVGDGWRER